MDYRSYYGGVKLPISSSLMQRSPESFRENYGASTYQLDPMIGKYQTPQSLYDTGGMYATGGGLGQIPRGPKGTPDYSMFGQRQQQFDGGGLYPGDMPMQPRGPGMNYAPQIPQSPFGMNPQFGFGQRPMQRMPFNFPYRGNATGRGARRRFSSGGRGGGMGGMGPAGSGWQQRPGIPKPIGQQPYLENPYALY